MTAFMRRKAQEFGLLNEHNIFRLARELVELAEALALGSGAQKKAAVLDALRFAISLMHPGTTKDELLKLLAHAIPDAIDLAIALAKSKVFNGKKWMCC